MIFTGKIPFEPKPSDNIAWQSDIVISFHRLGQGHIPGYYTACSSQKSFIPEPLCWVCQTGAEDKWDWMTSQLSDSEKMPWKEMASEKDKKTM